MTKASDNQYPKVTFAESAAPSTPASGLAVMYVKTDGKAYLKDDAGTETDITGAGGAGVTAIVNYTAGNFTLNNTGNHAAVHASGLDLTVAATAGDVFLYGISGLMDANSASEFTMFDVGTIVSAAIVNRISGLAAGGIGVLAWLTDSDAPQYAHVSGSYPYTVVSGDISGGNVTFRLLYRTSAASNTTLRANSTEPLTVWVAKQ